MAEGWVKKSAFDAATSISPADIIDFVDVSASANVRGTWKDVSPIYSTLSADVSASATSIAPLFVPDWVQANGAWVVIDFPTTECEVRKITAVSGNTLTVAALDYAHSSSDPVLFITAPTVNVKWFGAKGDGTTDDYTAIARALTQAGGLGNNAVCLLPSDGQYNVSTGLDVPAGVELRIVAGAKLYLTADVNAVRLRDGARVTGGGAIDCSGITLTNAAVYLDGSDTFATDNITAVDDINLISTGQNGYGIHCYANGNTHYISFCRFTNITIDEFGSGLRLEAIDPGGGNNSWVNGNIFDNITMSFCERFIETIGNTDPPNAVNRNFFTNIHGQCGAATNYAVWMQGQGNYVRGVFWDPSNAAGSDLIYLDTTSMNNRIMVSATDGTYWNDQGINNLIDDFQNAALPRPLLSPPHGIMFGSYPSIVDEYLTHVDLWATATLTGTAPSSGDVRRLFDLEATYTKWNATTAIDTVATVITVDFGATTNGLIAMAVLFGQGEEADEVTFEYYDGSWNTLLSKTGNRQHIVYRGTKPDAPDNVSGLNGITQLRYTFRGLVGSQVNIYRLCAWFSTKWGTAYVKAEDGTFTTAPNFIGIMANSTKDPTTDAPDDWVEVKIAGTTYYLPAYLA